MMLQFTKMQGAGNDFIVLDATRQKFVLGSKDIQRLADRHYGIGFDQLLVVEPSSRADADFKYRIFNADGAEVQMCGNGARCFAVFVYSHGLTLKRRIRVETLAGIIEPEILENGTVRVDMGRACFDSKKVPFLSDDFESEAQPGGAALYRTKIGSEIVQFGVVSMGNPHAVCFVDEAETVDIEKYGFALQHSGAFPEGVNVGFLQVLSRTEAVLRVYERGVGETLACGTGACAAFSLANRCGFLSSRATMHMRGGDLVGELSINSHIFLSGPAVCVFEGSVQI